MKIKFVVFCLLSLLLLGCYGIEKPKKPDNLIPEDKMVDVLVEIAIVSAGKGINKRTLENKGITPVAFIYKKHNIDSLQFVNSNNYYAYDIETFDNIYSKVKDSLTLLRDKYKEQQKKEDKQKAKNKDKQNNKTSKEKRPRFIKDSSLITKKKITSKL